MTNHLLKFDGASKGNPGPASGGAVCYNGDERVFEVGAFLDKTTNNVAEYTGLIIGLKKCKEKGIKNLVIKGDSQLIINQMLGTYAVKDEKLKELYKEAKEVEDWFDVVEYHWVRREFNSDADALTNEVLRLGAGFYRDFASSAKPAVVEAAEPAQEPSDSAFDRETILNLFSIPIQKPATSQPLETLGNKKELVRQNVLSQLLAESEEVRVQPSPSPSQPPLPQDITLVEILKEIREIRILLEKNRL